MKTKDRKKMIGMYPCDERYLKRTDSRFETLGLPCGLHLFDPTVSHSYSGKENRLSKNVRMLTSVHDLQGHLECIGKFIEPDQVSLQVARAVVKWKTSYLEKSFNPQEYMYLYTIEYRSWYHHFLRDECTGSIISLGIPSHAQSGVSFLCVEGEKVLALICEGYRPGEKAIAYTGLSLEALLPSIENHQPLSLSSGKFLIVGVLGEGFESVVLRVRNQANGAVAALKLGKLTLEDNYQALQPTLAAIQKRGISVPQYILYDAHVNGILMEYREGEKFTKYIEQMEQKQRTLFEVLQIYVMCLNKLIALNTSSHLSHGDAHEGNWLIDGDTPTLIDFRHSPIPFTSTIYQHRDIFAMLCTLYRLVYAMQPINRQEVKHAIMQQCIYPFESAHTFPKLDHENRFDPLLQQFLRYSVYNPQAYTLQDIAQVVNIYLSGFDFLRQHDDQSAIHHSVGPYVLC